MKRLIALFVALVFCFSFVMSVGAAVDTDFQGETAWVDGTLFCNANYVAKHTDMYSSGLGFSFGDYSVILENKGKTSSYNSYDYYDIKVYQNGSLINTVSDSVMCNVEKGGYITVMPTYIPRSNYLEIFVGWSDNCTYLNTYSSTGIKIPYADIDISEPEPTMYLHNVSDPLTSDFYVGVNNPMSKSLIMKVFYRAYGSDDYEPLNTFDVENGYYTYTAEDCGVYRSGSYQFVLYGADGLPVALRYMDLSTDYSDGLSFVINNRPADGENLTKDFNITVYNPALVKGRLEVSNLKTGENVKDIYLLTFNGLSTGFGTSFDKVNKKELNLNFTDLGLTEKGSFKFDLYDENDNLVQTDSIYISGYDYTGNSYHKDTENGNIVDDYDYDGLFDYPELPDDANVVDYIKWICQCIVVTFSSLAKVISNFTLSCANFAKMIMQFMNFMPTEFVVMIPIILAVCLLLRFLGR